MRVLLPILIFATTVTQAQPLTITTLDKTRITVTIVPDSTKQRLIKEFHGRQDDSLRKKYTARTWRLSDGQVLLEFYDRRAALIDSPVHLQKLERVSFVKNNIAALKKNISYRIDLSPDEAKMILEQEHPKRRSDIKSEFADGGLDFDVYELASGQLLYMRKGLYPAPPGIFADLKTMASTIEIVPYFPNETEFDMKMLASGDPMSDYELKEHFLYPKYLPDVIHNQQLTLIKKKVYVEEFYGNLYHSAKGYYMLIDEVHQKNGAGDTMKILTLRVYDSLSQVKAAQKAYENSRDKGPVTEHFYQKLSDRYGEQFPQMVPKLIDSLPILLNFDKTQLAFDSSGIDLVDEALAWNNTNDQKFETIFPSVVAYLGQYYITNEHDGKWAMLHDDGKVWVPELRCRDGKPAWDWIDLYKHLFEGPIPLRSFLRTPVR